ncbi:MAG: hypothetical protein AAB539_00425 [Patescibacteria group bacterium]
MTKDILIIVLVIALVGTIGAGFYFARKGPLVLAPETNQQVCDILPLYSGSLDGGGSSGGQMPYIAQDVCRIVFADEKGDSEICAKIRTPELQGQCVAGVALKKGDATLCEGAIGEARDRCYDGVAQKLGAEACTKIRTVDKKDSCLSNAASRQGDGSMCRQIANVSMRDQCYMNTAFRNPALCNDITQPMMREECGRNVRGR